MEKTNSNKKLYIIIAVLGVLLVIATILLIVLLNKDNKKEEEPVKEPEKQEEVEEKEPYLTEDELKTIAEDLYGQYITFASNESMHYEANIEDDSKNDYMIIMAVENIMKDKKHEVPCLNVEQKNGLHISIDEEQFLKIKLSDIEAEIRKYFPDTVEIDFSKIKDDDEYPVIHASNFDIQINGNYAEIYQVCNAAVTHYSHFSKLNSYELVDEQIVLETTYFGYAESMAWISLYEDSFVQNDTYRCTTDQDYVEPTVKLCNKNIKLKRNNNDKVTNYNDISEYVFSELSEYTTKYKHTFAKDEEGNYYWISTEKVK